MAYVEGDFPITVGNGGNNSGTDGIGGWWGIVALVAVAAIFGWNGNGGLFGGGSNGGASGALTRGDLCQDMNFNNLESAVRGVQQGLCDGFYTMNTSLLNGFGNTNTAIMQNGYETRSAISDLGYRQQQCCCGIETAIQNVNFNMAQNTCALQNTMNNNTRDIIQSQQSGTQRILDYLCNEKISALQAENAALTSQLSQNSQTQTIINALQPIAKPAYLTCSPYQSAYGFGLNNNCGCGCGCNG